MTLREYFGFYKDAIHCRFRKPHKKSNKILIIQLSGLGDACTLIPFVQTLKTQNLFHLDLLVAKGLKDLWEYFLPEISIHEITAKTTIDLKNSELFEKLKIAEYETIISTSISPFGAYLSSLPRSRKRLGIIEENRYYKGSRSIFTEILKVKKNQHVFERFSRLFRKAGFSSSENMAKKLKNEINTIAIHPGAKWIPRRWPKEKFLILARFLAKSEYKVKILLNDAEADLKAYFKKEFPEDNISLINTQSILDLINEINQTELFIGNDSGPAHLANLLNKHTIVLWGPGNYKRIRPLGNNVSIIKKEISCRPCKQYINEFHCEIGENKCLQMISVQEVQNKVFSLSEKVSNNV